LLRATSRLGADAGEHRCCAFHEFDQPLLAGDWRADDRPAGIQVRFVHRLIGARPTCDALNDSADQLDRAEHVSCPPIVVGWIGARGDPGGCAMDRRAASLEENQHAHGPQPRPAAAPGSWQGARAVAKMDGQLGPKAAYSSSSVG